MSSGDRFLPLPISLASIRVFFPFLHLHASSQPSSNQFQFLLSTCKEKPKISKELEDAQRLDKSLFIQELLVSSIENFFKHDLKFERSGEHRISLDQSGLDVTRPETRQEPKTGGELNGVNDESRANKEQPINGESSQNNQREQGPGAPTTEPAKAESQRPVEGQQVNESQQINESNQSNQQTNNNQELNNQTAKGDNTGGANSETASCNAPATSNSVDKGADHGGNTSGCTPSNVSTPGNLSEAPAESRNDQQPAR